LPLPVPVEVLVPVMLTRPFTADTTAPLLIATP
jgi:hypothetical protein